MAELAAADAIEWGTRRLDLFILGQFTSPAIYGIYYMAQQVASLPQKLKTSFEPILSPVITKNLRIGNMEAIAAQVRQVGFWIIAVQLGIALVLGVPAILLFGIPDDKDAVASGAHAAGGVVQTAVAAIESDLMRDGLLLLRDELRGELRTSKATLLDGRAEQEYWGETVRAARGGVTTQRRSNVMR